MIATGGSATLLWNVTGATTVTIDQGIGDVPAAGIKVVSPAANTTYTLTATNAAGSVTKSITLVVGVLPPPPPAIDTTPPTVPTLQTPSDLATLPQKTAPWTFNWSDSYDPDSGIRQYQLQVYRPGQPPFIDVYVTASNYSKTVEVAYPYLSNWKWRVRAQNNAGLWSAWSAERTFNVEPRVAYDFVDKAPTAYWWSKVGEALPFPGATNDNRGFATFLYNTKLNDGRIYAKVLETHPRWVDNGWISGKYSAVLVPSGARLKVKVGFVSGAGAGKVEFRIRKLGAVAVLSLVSAYADGVREMEVDLGAYAGQTIDFVLGAYAEGTSAQDWAAWVEARIVH